MSSVSVCLCLCQTTKSVCMSCLCVCGCERKIHGVYEKKVECVGVRSCLYVYVCKQYMSIYVFVLKTYISIRIGMPMNHDDL